MLDKTERPPIIHAAFDRVEFDLWCEDEWLEFKDRNYFYEQDLLYAFLHFVRPGDVCIDAGANLGYHTLFLSRLVGDAGGVIAYEPDPTHFAKLTANIELNKLNNVQAFQHALWSCQTKMDFWSVKGGGYSSFARFVNFSPDKVPDMLACRLDDIIAPDVSIRLIKLDCEGAEEQILLGAKSVLARTDCVVMEFNFGIMHCFGSTDRAIRDYMAGYGFDMYVLRRDGSEPFYVKPELEIKMEGRKPHMFNALFAKRGIYTVENAPKAIAS